MAATDKRYSRRMEFIIKETHESATNLIIHDYHVIKGSRILTLYKLSSTKIYAILISEVQNKPSPNFCFKSLMAMILTAQQFISYRA